MCEFSAVQTADRPNPGLLLLAAPTDTGFGVTPGEVTARPEADPAATPVPLSLESPYPWNPSFLYVRFPDEPDPGRYVITVTPAVGASCDATVRIVDFDAIPPIASVITIPPVAPLGSQVYAVSLDPTFRFTEDRHKPVTLADAFAPRKELEATGWGANYLRLQLPTADEYPEFMPAQPDHLIVFNESGHRTPITLLPGDGTLAGEFQLLVTGFTVHETGADEALDGDGPGLELYLTSQWAQPWLSYPGAPDFDRSLRAGNDEGRRFGGIGRGARRGFASVEAAAGSGVDVAAAIARKDLPFEVWRGPLATGRNAAVICPLIWEWDGGRHMDSSRVEPDWPVALSDLGTALAAGLANAVRSRIGLPDLGLPGVGPFDPTSGIVSLAEAVRGDTTSAVTAAATDLTAPVTIEITRNHQSWPGTQSDYPVGLASYLAARGRDVHFPQVVVLTYEIAKLLTSTPGHLGDPAPGGGSGPAGLDVPANGRFSLTTADGYAYPGPAARVTLHLQLREL